jgi:hypothetical protein
MMQGTENGSEHDQRAAGLPKGTLIMISISHVAPDKKRGLTFADLRQFVSECINRDMPDNASIKATVGWSEQIQQITATEHKETLR